MIFTWNWSVPLPLLVFQFTMQHDPSGWFRRHEVNVRADPHELGVLVQPVETNQICRMRKPSQVLVQSVETNQNAHSNFVCCLDTWYTRTPQATGVCT
jgi:hypothetical protein